MQTLDKPFRDLTQAVFARYGFAYGELLSQWPAIVGEVTAQICQPEKISWPRRAGESRQRLGGTLVLRALPGRALELQYETPRLIERINGFYGYSAIVMIKIRQAATISPKPANHVKPGLETAKLASLDAELAAVADEDLRAALRRLGSGVLASPEGSQQDQ